MAHEVPDGLYYTEEHEWLRVEGDEGVVGITAYAQDQLGDVVFVELPEVGAQYRAGEAFGVVESVKTVSDVYMPVSARVVAVNGALADRPELVNQDPYGEGWLVRIQILNRDELAGLLDAAAYRQRTS
ncbi:glycine cleavage system H protein [Thermaerobacter marianensis DSM 12885]|uniref:Glycine cleavage system H protein n=1 Tax=Thermaerobacter marianensis (strain ATCC 700841 / DSM 12885 / JCM 10246 / 7p75a) TaxID=644966 RepID=E6SL73_THEM7|nr:glycine cleavage system protein GcvH [Thermaerobacter marianensis]ADU51304.1 glycine cleavage system H protein [Thermaerobacter marianensis DSM 12885]